MHRARSGAGSQRGCWSYRASGVTEPQNNRPCRACHELGVLRRRAARLDCCLVSQLPLSLLLRPESPAYSGSRGVTLRTWIWTRGHSRVLRRLRATTARLAVLAEVSLVDDLFVMHVCALRDLFKRGTLAYTLHRQQSQGKAVQRLARAMRYGCIFRPLAMA